MTNKNTGDTNETAADLPIPNGHGKNGTPATTATNAAASVKKRKKKRPPAEAKTATPPAQQEDSAPPAVPTAPANVPQTEVVEADAPTQTPTPEVSEPVAAAPEPAATAPEPAAAAPEPAAAAPEPTAAPEGLKLRMKIWTDPATSKRYLMPTAFMRDVINGQPVSDVMYAYAMSDEDTKLVTLRAHEWNTLPFSYFQEIGPAPRASERPIDVVPAGPSGSRSP